MLNYTEVTDEKPRGSALVTQVPRQTEALLYNSYFFWNTQTPWSRTV